MEAITAKRWKVVRAMALGLLTGTVHFCAHGSPPIFREDVISRMAREASKDEALEAIFRACSLEKLPMTLGSCFPSLRRLTFMSMPCVPVASPTGDQRKSSTVACKYVKRLELDSFPGSLTTIDWAKLFFPNVNKLVMTIESLPIQNHDAFDRSRLEAQRMKSVTKLKLVRVYDDRQEGYPPLAENLELFPSLTTLALENERSALMLEDLVKSSQSPGLIKRLKICNIRAPPELLISLMGMFSLRELSVGEESFCMLMEHFSGVDSSFDSPFKPLAKLGVDCKGKRVCFDARMAKIFPAVAELSIKDLPPFLLPVPFNKDNLLRTIKTVKIADSYLRYVPSLFGSLFPSLESLALVNCKVDRLFGSDSLRERSFFASLKSLSISNNEGLRSMLPQLEQFRPQPQEKPNSLSNFGGACMAFFGHSSNSVAADEPLAPKLESLDIRNTFCFSEAPCWFFLLFPGITNLKVSDTTLGDATEEHLRMLFKPLKKLKLLDVELSQTYNLPLKETVAKILSKLKKPLRSHPTIRFFASCSSEPIALFTRWKGLRVIR